MDVHFQLDDEPKQEIYDFCDRQLCKYDDPIMRDAMAHFIVKHVVWACFERVNIQHDLADHLDTMADCVRDAIKEGKVADEQAA